MLVQYLQAEHLENFAKFLARIIEDEKKQNSPMAENRSELRKQPGVGVTAGFLSRGRKSTGCTGCTPSCTVTAALHFFLDLLSLFG